MARVVQTESARGRLTDPWRRDARNLKLFPPARGSSKCHRVTCHYDKLSNCCQHVADGIVRFFMLCMVIGVAPTEDTANVARSHPLRMHPFLKHRVISKTMRDLVYRRRQKRDECNPAVAAALGQILKDMQTLRVSINKNISDEECKINGVWTAEVAGRNIKFGSGHVTLRKFSQKSRLGFMGRDHWNATYKHPFKDKCNYIMVVAKSSTRKVATFLGECRICRNRPLVMGHWLVAHRSRDCESIGTTDQLFGDVWRRDNIQKLVEKGKTTTVKNKTKKPAKSKN